MTKPIVVKKGELVTLVFSLPGIELTAAGQALADGGKGDAIPVLNARSRRTVQGSVIGPGKLVGVSTHNREQFQRATATSVDYIAVGPIFSTSTKANPDPVVGTEFVRQIRPLTDKPIVAIGGITLERAAEVIRAGADSVAVVSDVLRAPDPGARARQYLDLLDAANHAAGA